MFLSKRSILTRTIKLVLGNRSILTRTIKLVLGNRSKLTSTKQLVVGNYGLSRDEERVQMGLWSMFASPLLMSVDLRHISHVSKSLLLNSRVIAINQDPLGIQAHRVLSVSLPAQEKQFYFPLLEDNRVGFIF